MSPIDPSLLSRCWNELYGAGRYAEEAPLPFVAEILAVLRQEAQGIAGPGLYVGCGNGRNYRALLRAEVPVYGLDISEIALTDLLRRSPAARGRLICADFQTFDAAAPFAFLVAIQVFQHGSQSDVAAHFRKAAELLRPGGLLFVRVNSTACEIFFDHRPLDENEFGGYSVECLEGAKLGQPVHFFSHAELLSYTEGWASTLSEPRERREFRPPPRRGSWGQWEAVFQKRGRDTITPRRADLGAHR